MKKLLFSIFIIVSYSSFCQIDTVKLLKPNGNFSVGTMIYEWTDTTREFNYSSHIGDKRTIIVQIWYPAELDSNSVPAPYSALSKDYQNVLTNGYLSPSFTNKIKKSPLILFSPGRGTERYLYTTLAEELASNGFMVASVDMPGIGYTIYKDGFIIKPSPEFKPPRGMMGGPYEKVDEFFERPTEIGFMDLEFALKKITALNRNDINYRFKNKIDLDNIGIFGHSLGGRIGGEFTSRNKNVKAFISMEGIPPRYVRFKGEINIPIVMLCSSGTWPYAKENYFSLIDNRSNSVYMIELLGFGHNSVTDNPFVYPEYFNYDIDAIEGLKISREIVTQYFLTYLKNANSFDECLSNIDKIQFKLYK